MDARNGRFGRDARTFTLLIDIGWVRNPVNPQQHDSRQGQFISGM